MEYVCAGLFFTLVIMGIPFYGVVLLNNLLREQKENFLALKRNLDELKREVLTQRDLAAKSPGRPANEPQVTVERSVPTPAVDVPPPPPPKARVAPVEEDVAELTDFEPDDTMRPDPFKQS